MLLPGTLYEGDRDPEGVLSTIPAIATVLTGVLAGDWLRLSQRGGKVKAAWLFVAGLACVDYVVLFAEPTATRLVRELRPDVVCKGGEYRDVRPPEQEAVEQIGGRFVHLRQVPGLRSTHLLSKLRDK